jgi:HEAT repeat protein
VLIELSKDPVDEVRDWATFGLGSILGIDSTQIRDALADRLDDTHFDTSCEALVGLATRKDPRAFERTLELLQSEAVPRLAVDAAQALGDPRLLPALRDLKGWWDVDTDLLDKAIARCGADEAT